MKNKVSKLGALLISLILVAGCNNVPSGSSISISSNDSLNSELSSSSSSDSLSSELVSSEKLNSESSSSSNSGKGEQETINDYLLSDLKDNFTYSKGTYVSKTKNSAKVFSTPLSTGEFSTKLNYQNNSGEHYLVFNHSKIDNSYDAFGVNNQNKLQLVHFDGREILVNKTFDNVINNEVDLKVKIYETEDVVELFLNNDKIYSSNLNVLSDRYLGIYTSSDNTKFSNINMDTNPFKELNNYEDYTTTYGSSIIKNNGIQMTGNYNLVVPNNVSLMNGSFEVTINVQDAGKNAVGVVFRMDDQGKSTYFKNHVPCYFLHFGITGSLTLVKQIEPGVQESLKYYVTPFFQKDMDHKLKVILDDGMIHVLLDGQYCFGYEDTEYLTGEKIGFCNFDGNGFYKDLKVVSTDKLLKKEIDNFEVVSGDFTSINELTYSTKVSSMMVSKEKIPTDGTLETKIGTINQHGHGLVFRLTKPNVSKYYQNESGLSYYFIENCGDQYYRLGRVENGRITYSKKSYVATSIGHGGNVKVVMNGGTIYVYFTDRLVIKYEDQNPLMGEYYGYRAANEYGLFQGDIAYSESIETDKADYLIFGHSYTNLWLSYKKDFKELGDSVLDVGIGGARTLHYVTTAPEMAAYQPKWGIYWNGINDINADISISTMPTNIENTMLTIKETNPDFQCVIIGINRCTYQKSVERYEQIYEANLKYEELCNKYDWLHYLDVEYLYCNDEGIPQKSWFVDDLHPTLDAYAVVAELIVDVIQKNS